MSVVIKTNEINYKDPNTNQYVGLNAVAEKKVSDQIKLINAAGQKVISEIPRSYGYIEAEFSHYLDLFNQMEPTSGVLFTTDQVSSLMNIIYQPVDELMDELGDLIMFPLLELNKYYLQDYYTKQDIHNRIVPMTKELIKNIIGEEDPFPYDFASVFEFVDALVETDDNSPLVNEDGDLIWFPALSVKDDTKFIPEKYIYNSGSTANQYLALPILYLYGDTSKMTKDKKVTLKYRFKGFGGSCTCKWQGSSSVAYPKKNYTITFENKIKIVPKWGEQKKYVLKSEFYDNTHTRNTVCARLWAEITKDREERNKATTLDDQSGTPLQTEDGADTFEIVNSKIMGSAGCGANDGFHVMLVINNKYMGLYTFGIPKDDWMFGMDHSSWRNCCVLNAEKTCMPTQFRSTTTEDEIDNEETYSVEYSSDDMSLTDITDSINLLLDSVVNTHQATYPGNIPNYMDMDSAIDYVIYSLLIGNWDGVAHNFNLYTYDGVKWAFSAYDLDNTFGFADLNDWNFEERYDDPRDVSPTLPISSSTNRLFYLITKYGTEAFKQRYNELRQTILSECNIYTHFYNFISVVSKRVLAEEYNVWPTTPRSGGQTIDSIINFYRLRCEYMDNVINSL